jgi:hypothetical protein
MRWLADNDLNDDSISRNRCPSVLYGQTYDANFVAQKFASAITVHGTVTDK